MESLPRKDIPFPDLVEPSQEIGLLLAVQTQLKSLERLPPCKRKDALQVYLTEMLDIPFVPSYASLRSKLIEAEAQIKRLEGKMERLEKDVTGGTPLALPTVIIPENSSNQSTKRSEPKVLNLGRLFWIYFLGIVVLIALVIYHSLHS